MLIKQSIIQGGQVHKKNLKLNSVIRTSICSLLTCLLLEKYSMLLAPTVDTTKSGLPRFWLNEQNLHLYDCVFLLQILVQKKYETER